MSHLLAIDVGNSNTVLGVYDGLQLIAQWRVRSDVHRTADEYAVLMANLASRSDVEVASLKAAIVASVVPPVTRELVRFLDTQIAGDTLVVGPGMKTGMPILYENPREVGADRIVNAVAAYEKFKSGCIVVDFGTATTWDVVTPQGEYLGGAIAPGIEISSQALYERASKLPRVELSAPESVVGRNTIASMQAGIVYGGAAIVDGMVRRIRAEVEFETRVVATGGIAELFHGISETIESYEEMLTLEGLRILFERNPS